MEEKAGPIKCPSCGVVNEPNSGQCDCGESLQGYGLDATGRSCSDGSALILFWSLLVLVFGAAIGSSARLGVQGVPFDHGGPGVGSAIGALIGVIVLITIGAVIARSRASQALGPAGVVIGLIVAGIVICLLAWALYFLSALPRNPVGF